MQRFVLVVIKTHILNKTLPYVSKCLFNFVIKKNCVFVVTSDCALHA